MNDEILFDKLSKALSVPDVLDNIDAGINIFDAKGNFLFMNTVMINWRNIPRKEYLKMNVHDFNSVLDVCVFDLVCKYKKRISRLQYYRNYQQVNSPTRVRIVTGTPIFDGTGNIKFVIMLLQDVDNFEKQHRTLLEEHKILNGGAIEGGREEPANMIAKSPEILQLLAVTDNIAPLDSTVLLYGESGTGKEVFAKYIHEHSKRSKQPLITVNCAAFPENLIEAELFGYEKGSFTGASREGKAGLAEAANGGTLFLDEINSLPLSVQGKVLRMIEEKSVRRVGSLKDKKTDFRLIAATNRSLNEMVQQHFFREDLYYRLNVIPLTIPPLRNRKGDIVPLCLHFLYYFCQKYNLQKSLSEEVLKDLQQYPWPGNVRELRNCIERLVVMTPSAIKEISSIPKGMLEKQVFEGYKEKVNNFYLPQEKLGKESLIAALAACGNRREATAEYLGVSRRQLQYLIKKYHISSRCRYVKVE
jgi:transcriptional regulator with PAS, ATPase and Fis domain